MPVWRNDYIPVNKWTRPGTKLKKVVKLIDHYTANPGASAKNHAMYFGRSLPQSNDAYVRSGKSRKTRSASAHIFVDRYEAVCIIPLDEVAYAANDGSYRDIPELRPNANYLSISVEKCIEKDGSFHPDTIKRAKQVFAELCKMFNLDPIEDIVRHYDVTRKNCPAPYVKNPALFNQFKAGVSALLKTKEEPFMLEKAIVVNAFGDSFAAEPLAKRLKCPIFFRDTAEQTQVAKTIYVCGGSKEGLKGTKFVELTGSDRWEAAKVIGDYTKKV